MLKYQPTWQLNEILDRISVEQMAWPDNFEDTLDLVEKIEAYIAEAAEQGYIKGYDHGYVAHNDILSGGHS